VSDRRIGRFWPRPVTLEQQISEMSFWALTATKRNPGQSTLPGFYRLLPQLVGSFDPGGGVSRDGNAARVGPLKSNLIGETSHGTTAVTRPTVPRSALRVRTSALLRSWLLRRTTRIDERSRRIQQSSLPLHSGCLHSVPKCLLRNAYVTGVTRLFGGVLKTPFSYHRLQPEQMNLTTRKPGS
jgi:hypothetical protein